MIGDAREKIRMKSRGTATVSVGTQHLSLTTVASRNEYYLNLMVLNYDVYNFVKMIMFGLVYRTASM